MKPMCLLYMSDGMAWQCAKNLTELLSSSSFCFTISQELIYISASATEMYLFFKCVYAKQIQVKHTGALYNNNDNKKTKSGVCADREEEVNE